MKGIILAGGSGSRLYPITKSISKQLLPVYDKPMIYYPLSILLNAKIKEILIISTPHDLPNFKKLLGDGSKLGIILSYAEQPNPEGLAQAFIIGQKFIGNDSVCLVLGDNIFYGQGLNKLILNAKKNVEINKKSSIFGYYVNDPERYGVAEFDKNNNIISIEEKPSNPKSNYAIVGLYFYTNDVIKVAKNIKPSKRGELEITSVNEYFLKKGNLILEIMDIGFAWLDTGTYDSLNEASNFVQTIEKRQGLKIACLEEIAYKHDFISKEHALKLAESMNKTTYGKYLKNRILKWNL